MISSDIELAVKDARNRMQNQQESQQNETQAYGPKRRTRKEASRTQTYRGITESDEAQQNKRAEVTHTRHAPGMKRLRKAGEKCIVGRT